MSVYRVSLIETIEPKVRPANQVIVKNTWLQYDDVDAYVPLKPKKPVIAIAKEGVSSTDPNFGVRGMIHVDTVTSTIDRFDMDVTVGSAIASTLGKIYDVDPIDSGGLDVTVIGTQFEVTKVINPSKVEIRAIFCCDKAIS